MCDTFFKRDQGINYVLSLIVLPIKEGKQYILYYGLMTKLVVGYVTNFDTEKILAIKMFQAA